LLQLGINLVAEISGKIRYFSAKIYGKEMFYLANKMELTTFGSGKVSFPVQPEQHNNFLSYVCK